MTLRRRSSLRQRLSTIPYSQLLNLLGSFIFRSESAFLHRLAVRRKFAGGLVSKMLLQWTVERSRELGKHFLRLDCVVDRPRLRSVYENFGFRHHRDRQVGAYFVARYEYEIANEN
jgi:GNAT superfamily N-acetyltransferase